jgi:hypothetical protein
MKVKAALWVRLLAVAVMPILLLGLFFSWPRDDDRESNETDDQAFLMPRAVQTPYRPPTEPPDPVATARAQPQPST